MSNSKDTIPYGYCHCGCGQKTNISPRTHTISGHIKGIPFRFILNHHPRLTTPAYEIDPVTGCWNWLRYTSHLGYGKAKSNGRLIPAHRLYYERKYGPIPGGLDIDHLCRNRRCVNPDHLEAVTTFENIRRGMATKLTWDDVRRIRSLGASMTQQAIADMFGIGNNHVSRILSGQCWKEPSENDGGPR